MRVVEALYFLTAKRKINCPRRGASAIATLHLGEEIGPIAAFEALHLAVTRLQQASHSQSLSTFTR